MEGISSKIEEYGVLKMRNGKVKSLTIKLLKNSKDTEEGCRRINLEV